MIALQITAPTQGHPLPMVQWNYEEVKQSIQSAISAYQGRVYTAEDIPSAKSDRAKLNTLAKALSDKRIEVKKQYLDPYTTFENQCKELTGMVNEVSGAIDAQVKAFDDAYKEEKRVEIEAFYNIEVRDLAELVPLQSIWNDRWLNKTYTIAKIHDDVSQALSLARADMMSIKSTCGEDANACLAVYFRSGRSLNAAIQEREKLQGIREAMKAQEQADLAKKAKLEELERMKAARQRALDVVGLHDAPEPPPAPVVEPQQSQAPQPTEQPLTVDFRVWATKSQLDALKVFLKSNNIKYGRVPTANNQ